MVCEQLEVTVCVPSLSPPPHPHRNLISKTKWLVEVPILNSCRALKFTGSTLFHWRWTKQPGASCHADNGNGKETSGWEFTWNGSLLLAEVGSTLLFRCITNNRATSAHSLQWLFFSAHARKGLPDCGEQALWCYLPSRVFIPLQVETQGIVQGQVRRLLLAAAEGCWNLWWERKKGTLRQACKQNLGFHWFVDRAGTISLFQALATTRNPKTWLVKFSFCITGQSRGFLKRNVLTPPPLRLPPPLPPFPSLLQLLSLSLY